MYSFHNLELACCSMSSSNCCFLTCIQFSQEAGEVIWYSHLFKNFPQFVVIHIIKGFGILSKAQVDVFLEFSYFFYDPTDVGSVIPGSSAFFKSSLYIWKFSYWWSLAWRILSITLLACEMSVNLYCLRFQGSPVSSYWVSIVWKILGIQDFWVQMSTT